MSQSVNDVIFDIALFQESAAKPEEQTEFYKIFGQSTKSSKWWRQQLSFVIYGLVIAFIPAASFLKLIICECILRGNIFLSNPRPTLVNLDSHSSHRRLLSTFHFSLSSFYHQYYHYLTSPMKVINLSLFQERSPHQITASVKVSGEIHQALWSDRLVRSVLIPKFRLLKYCLP